MGIGAVIGGALQGFGAGVAQQGAIDAKARFDAALESTRTQNKRAEMTMQADLQDRNDARSVSRGTDAKLVVEGVKAKNDAAADDRKFSQQVKLKAIDLSNDMAKARLQDALSRASDATKRAMESGDITDVKQGDDGQYYGITRTGETKALGVYAAEKESDEAIGGIGSGPRNAAAQAPAPAPKSRASIGSKPTGQAGGKVYTLQEAQQTAKNRNIPIEAVHRAMRAAGYKLTAN